jgi:hypothetical protein
MIATINITSAQHSGQHRYFDPVHERRPQRLQRIGEADKREQTDGRALDIGLTQPGAQRTKG